VIKYNFRSKVEIKNWRNIFMKKAFTNAKEPLFVSLYFIVVYGVSLYLTILTHWNFGVFFFGIIMTTLIITAKRIDEKTPERVRR
jgi:hypothetical protein